jgi:hypothetical protein
MIKSNAIKTVSARNIPGRERSIVLTKNVRKDQDNEDNDLHFSINSLTRSIKAIYSDI